MEEILEKITEWLKGMLVEGTMHNLSGMFDAVNRQVADVASQVGRTPASFSPGIFAMIRNISETVIIPSFSAYFLCPSGEKCTPSNRMSILQSAVSAKIRPFFSAMDLYRSLSKRASLITS